MLRGEVGCDSCDEGTWSDSGSTSCDDMCDSGYFLHPTDGCTACSGSYAGADCSRKGSTLEELVLYPGYWR